MYSIAEPTMWFFQTTDEKGSTGTPRLKMLKGQRIRKADGTGWEDGDPSLNTQAPTKPRSSNSIGTVFVSKNVSIAQSATGQRFYQIKEGDLATISGGVSSDVRDAYKIYMDSVGGVIPSFDDDEAPVTPAVPTTSIIGDLLKKFPVPTVDKVGFYVSPDVWNQLLFNVQKGYNTMLVGESGTGKTELTKLLGEVMGIKVNIFDMAAKQDPIASLVGVHRFEDGKSVFDRADFTYAIERPEFVVMDELPRAPVNTNNILFPLLDSRRELTMDIASHTMTRTIKVHPDCRFIATANEGFRYTGNNVLDQALRERFQIVNVEFMPDSSEVKLLMKRHGISNSEAGAIVRVARLIREQAAKDDLTVGVSIRHTLYAADMISAGFKLAESMERAFLPMYKIADEHAKVKDIISSR